MKTRAPILPSRNARRRGTVLIIVLWVALGLVTITLYFAHAMSFELRASDNRVAGFSADQAIEGAARYVSYLLANQATNGAIPDPVNYLREAVPVGESHFWLMGRDENPSADQAPFSLIDESSRLNLNTATAAMLEALPRMTPELAGAILDWRDTDSNVHTNGGAETEIYARLRPPYSCKNTNFESTAELRLVHGMTLEILYGEDYNLNGRLDANENDGNVSPPEDNRDGQLDRGLLEYVTVCSQESNKRSDGSARINVGNAQGRQQLTSLLQDRFGAERANAILGNLGPPTATFRSLLEFFMRTGMSADEFAQIEPDITTANGDFMDGLINVNTASETVLACLPGIGTTNAGSLVAYRLSYPDKLNTVAWVGEALDRASAIQAGPYLTARSFQFTADIAAVGPYGRGYRRARFVFDTTEGAPKILFRQDLSHLGWALGRDVRQQLLLAKATR